MATEKSLTISDQYKDYYVVGVDQVCCINNEILNVEFENLKDMNLKLITQFHIEYSPANIEKMAKENLGMIKKRPKEIINEKEK